MSSTSTLLSPRAAQFRAAGLWRDRSMNWYLEQAIARSPDKLAVVAYRIDRDLPTRLSYRELGQRVDRAATSLLSMGVGHGDIVAVQLPNWWEFMVAALACGKIGAVVNPLMHIFRERELAYMLNFCAAKVFITADNYRGFDFAAMARGLRASLPHLPHLIIVGGDSAESFERRLMKTATATAAATAVATVATTATTTPTTLATSALASTTGAVRGLSGDDLAVIMFTSGTTGEPKGVMHTSNSMGACLQAISSRFGLVTDEVLHGASPLGHMTGYAAIMMLSVYLGATLVLQDVWESKAGVRIMETEGSTFTAASTPFLADICDAVAGGQPRPKQLRSFLCGGAPIPPALIERAALELNLKVCSLWGMTECLSGTLTEPARAHDKSAQSDGRAIDGMEVRVVDEQGKQCAPGETGRLLVRGASMYFGYYKKPELNGFDADGWFDSGDLARADDEGYIRINGRTKDIISRGGENIPVAEIENLLYQIAGVTSVALVAYPDQRLGERACAFVAMRPGLKIDLIAVQNHLAQCKVAKQYWPEAVEQIDELPRTASGKIQKFLLKSIATTKYAAKA